MIGDFLCNLLMLQFHFYQGCFIICLLALLMLVMIIIKINDSNGSDCFTRHLQFFVEWQFTIQ